MANEMNSQEVVQSLRILIVGAWLGELEEHINVLRDEGFNVTTHLPPGPEERAIDSSRFDLAVVDLRGLSPARDAVAVVEQLIQLRNSPIILTNTDHVERSQAQLDQLFWIQRGRNAQRFLDRWDAIKKLPHVRTSEYTTPSDLVKNIRAALNDGSS